MATSWIQAAVRFGFSLRLACPKELTPNGKALEWAKAEGGDVFVTSDVDGAVKGADCIVTDTWNSMGAAENQSRHNITGPLPSGSTADEFGQSGCFIHALFACSSW